MRRPSPARGIGTLIREWAEEVAELYDRVRPRLLAMEASNAAPAPWGNGGLPRDPWPRAAIPQVHHCIVTDRTILATVAVTCLPTDARRQENYDPDGAAADGRRGREEVIDGILLWLNVHCQAEHVAPECLMPLRGPLS